MEMFAGGVELEPPRIDSPRAVAEQAPDLSREHPGEISVFECRQPTDLLYPGATQALLCPWTDARQEPHGERRQKRGLASWRHDGDATRLTPIAGHLGDNLAGRHAQRAGETRRGLDGDLDGFCQGARLAEVRQDLREIQVTLVHPRALHCRDDLAHGRPDGARVLPVSPVSGTYEHRLRTPSASLRAAHRRADAVLASLVVGGGHYAPSVRVAADHEWPRGELRLLQLLDGCEEGVEIEMRDDRERTCHG